MEGQKKVRALNCIYLGEEGTRNGTDDIRDIEPNNRAKRPSALAQTLDRGRRGTIIEARTQ